MTYTSTLTWNCFKIVIIDIIIVIIITIIIIIVIIVYRLWHNTGQRHNKKTQTGADDFKNSQARGE